MIKLKDTLISVICPVSRNIEISTGYFEKLMDILKLHFEQFELILVDDGCGDQLNLKVSSLLKNLEAIRVIHLSRSFGIDVAITAGLDSCIGDYTVILIPEQDPPDRIPDAIKLAMHKNAIVVGKKLGKSEGAPLTSLFRNLFYLLSNTIFGLQLERNTTFFSVLPRQAVTYINRTKDKFRFLKTITAQIGLPIERFEYEYESNLNKRTFTESVGLSIDVIVTQSIKPLRIITFICALVSMLNFSYLAYIILVYFIKNNVAEGWPTLSLQISSGFFILFLSLAVFSEYIGYLISESKNRPLYYVREERNSSKAVANSDALNVLSHSTSQS